jgi:hypothetical protein
MRRLIEALRRWRTPAALRLAEDKRRLEFVCRGAGVSRAVARRVVAEFFNDLGATK